MNIKSSQWNEFVGLCEGIFDECDFQDELILACYSNADIAKVVFFHNRSTSLKWLQSEVPALDNQLPREAIRQGKIEEVKKVLLSFPC